ncbi:hypothetical protein PISMIDRAFT_378509 [Pisolithus microcarpus 441]|uniref:Uncharacterized protein n=1 Tax=Pisolithus microcarpus 441 TaxID=765257 RepID=A0A0C9Z1B9_9AGAM|nr:hypothetical protein PISMIDRAFT_378509 [Pisolithus microcarpus 441]
MDAYKGNIKLAWLEHIRPDTRRHLTKKKTAGSPRARRRKNTIEDICRHTCSSESRGNRYSIGEGAQAERWTPRQCSLGPPDLIKKLKVPWRLPTQLLEKQPRTFTFMIISPCTIRKVSQVTQTEVKRYTTYLRTCARTLCYKLPIADSYR